VKQYRRAKEEFRSILIVRQQFPEKVRKFASQYVLPVAQQALMGHLTV